MKKTILFAALLGGLSMLSCQQKATEPPTAEPAKQEMQTPPKNITTCNVRLDGIAFTHALNRGDTCISLDDKGVLSFRCTEKRDIFCDPNGKLSNNTVPMLLAEIDNTKPFTLTAKVTPGFTQDGLYNAADLFVYAHDTLWQKLAFEQDERGNHRIVSVRTQGTSDDNNHQKLDVPTVYLRFSSDAQTFASYYSLDKKEWHLVRLYENNYPDRLWVGIASQCPTVGMCTSLFEEVALEETSVSNFRTGE